jgi:hypothetical protein
MSFPQFGRLPTEIRLQIWEYCLPHRVFELDRPGWPFDKRNPSGCFIQTSSLNRRPPVISRVCRESRDVALANGAGLVSTQQDAGHPTWTHEFYNPTFAQDDNVAWFDPRRDVVYIDWDELVHAGDERGPHWFRWLDPVPKWLRLADQGRGACCTGGTLQGLAQAGEEYGPPAWYGNRLLRGRTLLLPLRTIAIHAPLEAALDSGLFGLLGDEPIVLVEATDTRRKQQFRAFWEAFDGPNGVHPVKDENAARFFDKYCDQDKWVEEEIAEVQQDWAVERWVVAHILRERNGGSDAAMPPDEQAVWPEGQEANREHPWVEETLDCLPELRPMIMFRLCTRDCQAPARGLSRTWDGARTLDGVRWV